MENDSGKIWYEARIDNKQLQADAQKSIDALKSIGDTAVTEGSRIDNAFKKAAAGIGLSLASISVSGFVQKMFQVRSEFQDTESSMRVFLGSAEKASDFMKKLQDYAWYNMFEFSDLTKESAKLLAFGNDVNSIIPILDKLSNIAAGTKEPLSEFVDLYNKAKNVGKIDAMGLQSWATKGVVITDVLKQMGVQVDSSAIKFEHLEMVLNKLTSEGGMFHGLMNEQMNNLSASFGQLQDDISIMFNEIGQKSEGTMKGAIDIADKLVKNYEQVGKTVLELAATYGVYRAALWAVISAQKVATGTQYATEIAELSKLLPLKEQSKFADIEAAVASGKLTQAKAEELIAIKAKVYAQLDELKSNQAIAVTELEAATASRKAALEKSIAIKNSISAKQTELVQSKLSGDAKKTEALQEELSTLAKQKDTVAIEMNNASKARSSAQSKVKSTSTAVETMTTNINTASETANATAHNILSIAKTKLTAVTARLNAVMMSNIYVLVAAAIAGLIYVVYKLVTAETAAEAAQRKHNEALEKAKEKKDALISKTNELINKIKDETQTVYAQTQAWKELQKEIPEVFKGMTMEELKKLSPAEIQSRINVVMDNREVESANKMYDDALQKVERLKNMPSGQFGNRGAVYSFSKQLEQANEDLKVAKEHIDEINRTKIEAEFNAKPAEEKLAYYNIELEKLKNEQSELDAILQKSDDVKNKWGGINLETAMNIGRLEFVGKKIDEIKGRINSLEGKNEPERVKNKSYWEEKKTTAENARSALDVSKKNSEEWNKYTNEIAKAQQEIEKYNKPKTGDKYNNELQKRLDAEKRLTEIEQQMALERERFNLDMRQRETDLMDESYDKRYRQLILNQDKELQAVKEFEQDKLKEQQKIEEEQWKKNGSVGTFKPATISVEQLPEDVKKQSEQMTKAARATYNKGIEEIKKDSIRALEEESMRLASALTEQLYEIRKNYADQIKAAQGNAALIKALEENRDKEIANTYSENRIKMIEFDKNIALKKTELSKNTYLWEADYQKKILEIQKQAAKDTLNELENELANSPLNEELKNKIKEVKLQIDELNQSLEKIPTQKLQEMLSGLQKVTNSLGGLGGELGDVFSSISSSIDNIKVAFSDTASTTDQVSAAISGIVDIINMVSSASAKRKQVEQEFYKNQIALAHEYTLALNEQLRTQSEISGSGFLTDYAGKINDGFNALTDATKNYQEALGKLSEGKAKVDLRNAIDWGATWKATGQGAAVGAAIGSMIVPVIGTAIGAVVGAIGGFFVGLFGSKKKKDVTSGLLDVFPELVDSAGNLNKELAQTLINTDQVDEKTKQLIQNALDWADAVEEANKQIKEIVTDLAGDLGNNLKKSIIDAWKAGEDASKNMFDAASKSLEGFVEDLLYSTIFSDVFKQFQQDLVDSLNPDTGDGINGVVDGYDRLMDNMDRLDDYYIALLDAIKKRAGERGFDMWKPDDASERKASAKGFESMSQDSANELNGRFTSIQAHTFEMNENLKVIVTANIESNIIASDIKNGMSILTANSERILNHLAGIENNTKYCERLEGIGNDMRAVKCGIDDINLKGVNIRK